jgi:hypothetical protein
MTKIIPHNQILISDASFQLIRTNPKLTGNLKVTVNENDEAWLDAIPANLELAKDDYARFPIDYSTPFAEMVYRFFKNGETPNEVIFGLKETVDLTKTSKDFKDQYDFSSYFSGIKYFPSPKYDERLSYFAPLYLKKEIPNYFIVFKIKDPLNAPIDFSKLNYEAGQSRTDFLIELFSKATLIKTFDLRPTTKIGKYIRDYLNSPNFPISPLTVSFEEDAFTTWNGIVIDSSTLGSKGELLYDQYKQSTPLKFFEENITKGYERNGVIFPNILNLEFIFNDESSENYELNRYIGFYVNAIELSELDIDLERMYAERKTWPNLPRLRQRYLESDETSLIQNNSTGVVLPYKNLDLNMAEFENIFSDSENLFFNYLSDREGKFYLPKLDQPYEINTTSIGKITLSNTQIDAAKFFGPTDQLFLQDKGTASNSSGYTYSVIKINANLSHLDEFKIYYPTGTRVDTNGKYDLITGVVNYAQVSSPGDFYAFNDFAGVIGFDVFYFNAVGLAKEIASAIASCINNFKNRTFTAYAYNEYVFIKCNSPGDFDAAHKISFFSPTLQYDSIELDGAADSTLTGAIFDFKGGSRFAGNRLVIDKEHYQKVEQEISNLLVRTTKDWSKISKISGYVDLVTEKNLTTPTLLAKAISEYENKMVITLVDEESPSIKYGDFIMRKKFRPEFGIFSLFPIKDLDFDFYSSTYLNYPQIDLYQNYYIPEEITLLQENQSYRVVTESTIKINDPDLTGQVVSSVDLSTVVPTVTACVIEFPNAALLTNFLAYSGAWLMVADTVNYFIGVNPLLISSTTAQVTIYSSSGSASYSAWTIYAGSLGANTGYDTFVPINNCSFSNFQGNSVVVYAAPTYSIALGAAYSRIEPIADENQELKDFPGFAILKDPTKVVPENTTDEYLFKTKYLNGLTQTEYDFYKENESSDFALRSKIIPYITKWGIKDGFDSRDNPYRLNTELVFGRNNFSPDHNDVSQNPGNFTHEWFYIESQFNYLNSLETVVQNNYYFDTPLDITKLISEEKYFLEYFTYIPAFGTEANGDPNEVAQAQFRYSNLFRNAAGQYETFFKGFKLLFKDVQDEGVIGEDGKPVAKVNSTRFDGYKFSCVLQPVKEGFFNIEQPPIRYRVIENTNAKHITIVIQIALATIDQISDYWFVPDAVYLPRYEKLTLGASDPTPTTGSSDRLFYSEPTPAISSTTYPFDTIYGDYRFAFDATSGISNLNHNLIYSIKNKKFNTLLDNFSNVKLSSQLNITIAGENGVSFPVDPISSIPDLTTGTIGKYTVPAISNYPSKLSDEVNLLGDLSIVAAKDRLFDQFFMIDQVPVITPENINPIQSAADSFLNFKMSAPYISLVQPSTSVPYTSYAGQLPISSSLTSYVRAHYSFFVIGGGKQYYERLFQKISFASFKNYVNRLDPFIEYESYTDGVAAAAPKFYLEIPDVSQVLNRSQVISQEITEVPTQFTFKKNVAYEYEQAPLFNELELNRYKGEYEPIAKDLLICRSGFNFKSNDIADLSLSNIRLNPDVAQFMNVLNFNHIKVSETKILDLESDESYLPVYPAIGEVAIGQADYFLLRSNWDWGFHHFYTNKTDSSPVAGSRRVEEDENFLSKILTVPANIELEQFALRQLASTEKLEEVDLTQVELVYKEGEFLVEGYININNVLTSYFITDGIEQKFNEYLVNSSEYIGNFDSIQEYVKEYIKLNLLKLYDLDTAQFFSKRNAALFSTTKLKNQNRIDFEFLNDAQRLDKGYSELKGVQINKTGRLIVRFSIQKELAAGLLVSPKLKIKFI